MALTSSGGKKREQTVNLLSLAMFKILSKRLTGLDFSYASADWYYSSLIFALVLLNCCAVLVTTCNFDFAARISLRLKCVQVVKNDTLLLLLCRSGEYYYCFFNNYIQ